MKKMTFLLALLVSSSMLAQEFDAPSSHSEQSPSSLFSTKGATTLATAFGVGTIVGFAGSKVLPDEPEWKKRGINAAKAIAALALGGGVVKELISETPFEKPLTLAQSALFIIGFNLGRLSANFFTSSPGESS